MNCLLNLCFILSFCWVQVALSSTNVAPSGQFVHSSNPFNSPFPKHGRRWKKGSSFAESVPTETNIESTTRYVAECEMPTKFGHFRMRSYVYSSPRLQLEPIAVICGDVKDKENVLVRVHDQCFTSEVFGSLRCDCREQLQAGLGMIQKEQAGVVIYLQQEGRGIGLANKIAAYSLQDQGLDTVEANLHLGFRDECREYHAVPTILKDLGIKSVRLMTNNPFKINELTKLGVQINERVSLQIRPNRFNSKYLESKRDKMNHFLEEMIPATNNNHNSNKKNPVVEEAPQQHVKEIITEHTTTIVQSPDDIVTTKPFDESKLMSLEGGATPDWNAQDSSDISTSSSASDDLSLPANDTSPSYLFPNVTYAFGKESVLQAIEAVKEGKVVIVVDDEDRENEGDLILAAEKATPENIGFLVRYTSGVICVSLEAERLEALALPPMVTNNEDPKQTAYAVSVDHKDTSTGISAFDRALTIRNLVDPMARKEDFQRPGHVFPLRYKAGGVLNRAGHTEASLDLTRLAGLANPGGVLAEIVHDDGSMMRLPALQQMAKEFNLVLTSVRDIQAYRCELEQTSSSSSASSLSPEK